MEEIGKITKPQGIKGEFRVRPNCVDFDYYKMYKSIYFNDTMHTIEKCVLKDGFVIFKVADISDRNITENLRNVVVYAEPLDLPKLPKNEYYVSDIIGFKVIGKSTKIDYGNLTSIDRFGQNEVYNVVGQQSFMFPNCRNVIDKIDTEHKFIFVDEKILEEIKSE